jgi:hypothetical protein
MMVLRYFSGLSADDEAKRFSEGGRRKRRRHGVELSHLIDLLHFFIGPF